MALRWPLEGNFELFWALVAKWLSDGLWRVFFLIHDTNSQVNRASVPHLPVPTAVHQFTFTSPQLGRGKRANPKSLSHALVELLKPESSWLAASACAESCAKLVNAVLQCGGFPLASLHASKARAFGWP